MLKRLLVWTSISLAFASLQASGFASDSVVSPPQSTVGVPRIISVGPQPPAVYHFAEPYGSQMQAVNLNLAKFSDACQTAMGNANRETIDSGKVDVGSPQWYKLRNAVNFAYTSCTPYRSSLKEIIVLTEKISSSGSASDAQIANSVKKYSINSLSNNSEQFINISMMLLNNGKIISVENQ